MTLRTIARHFVVGAVVFLGLSMSTAQAQVRYHQKGHYAPPQYPQGYHGVPLHQIPSTPGCLPSTPLPPSVGAPIPPTTGGGDPGGQGGTGNQGQPPVTDPTGLGAGTDLATPDFGGEGVGAGGSDVASAAAPGTIGDLGLSGFAFGNPGNVNGSVPALRGSFKITDNESPIPLDRIFLNYNYFSGVLATGSVDRFHVHVQTLGFEKTLLGDNFSVGARLPFIQTAGDGLGFTDLGDLSVFMKYALINNRQTGNVLSTGLIVTTPTGSSDSFNVSGNVIHETLIQPWLGLVYNIDRFYLQGFTSAIIPTNAGAVLNLGNTVSVGYRLFQRDNRACGDQGWISYVIPTAELNVTTPLRQVGFESTQTQLTFPSTAVIVTGGVHVGVGQRSRFTFGVGTPITGPRLFEVEGIIQFNLFF